MEIVGRERMQRRMRDLISKVQRNSEINVGKVAYKVHFSKPVFSQKIDCLIEFKMSDRDIWYARANGVDTWRSFCRAWASLRQLVTEIDMKEEKHAKEDGDAA